MTARVVGLDLSLRRTGIGVLISSRNRAPRLVCSSVFVEPRYSTTKIQPRTKKEVRHATLPDRHARLTELGSEIMHHAARADLVVVEGPLSIAGSGSTIDRHGLFWWIVGGLCRRDIPVAEISPTALKKTITGDGRADKVGVALAVNELYPGAVTNNDESDAAGLAHLGGVLLGWDVPTLARHRAATWTELPLFGLPEAAA